MTEFPVLEGEFQAGTELMLWRPGVDRTRLRRRAMWTRLLHKPAMCAGFGAGAIVLGADSVPQWIGLLLVFVGLIALGVSLLNLWITYRCADYDHLHGFDRPCYLDKDRGRYFYSRSDFTDLPPPTVDSVDAIITAVRDAYASPSVTWLAPQQLRDIHSVAWGALRALDQTRGLRLVLDGQPFDTPADDLVQAAQSHVAEIDEAVSRVLACLQHAVALVHAWEQKLSEAQVRAYLSAELTKLPPQATEVILRRAETLPENVFAYITAARDITNAGPFEWEQERS
jgi:hypothetical protein